MLQRLQHTATKPVKQGESSAQFKQDITLTRGIVLLFAHVLPLIPDMARRLL
jgi:hypothetical protein